MTLQPQIRRYRLLVLLTVYCLGAVDAAGVLHLVFGLNHQANYARSTDNGQTFSQPIKVNATGTSARMTNFRS